MQTTPDSQTVQAEEESILTLRLFECPRCRKRRMMRPKGHVVNCEEKEFKLPGDVTVKHHTDVCQACFDRIVKEFYTPKDKDLKKILKDIHDPKALEDKSLEEIL